MHPISIPLAFAAGLGVSLLFLGVLCFESRPCSSILTAEQTSGAAVAVLQAAAELTR